MCIEDLLQSYSLCVKIELCIRARVDSVPSSLLTIYCDVVGEDLRLTLKLNEIKRNQKIFKHYHTNEIRAIKSSLAGIRKSTGCLRQQETTPVTIYSGIITYISLNKF